MIAGVELDLAVAVDPEQDTARAAAERLLLARVVADGGMAVLRAHLARQEDELLRANAIRVDVDENREADPLEVPEPEVDDLDRFPLGRRQNDARVLEGRRRALPSQRHGRAGCRRRVQSLERARLAHRVVAREQQLARAADRVAHVLELEAVRILRLELDPLHLAVAA